MYLSGGNLFIHIPSGMRLANELGTLLVPIAFLVKKPDKNWYSSPLSVHSFAGNFRRSSMTLVVTTGIILFYSVSYSN
jgi:hypothetical protein